MLALPRRGAPDPSCDHDISLHHRRLAAAVAAIGQRLSKGEKVYIHSRRGGGRAAVVGACLLAAAYG